MNLMNEKTLEFINWMQTYCPVLYRSQLRYIMLSGMSEPDAYQLFDDMREKGKGFWQNWELIARGKPSLN